MEASVEVFNSRKKKDKLLNKLEENEPEVAISPEDECVICVNARATMQTSPCGHRVVCRKCFVKTIQMAVSQRLLPLRCVICRAKILRLRHSTYSGRLTTSKSWQMSTSGSGTSTLPKTNVSGSVSCYSMGGHSVPPSASLYSVTSGESSISAVSSASSASGESCNSKCIRPRCSGTCISNGHRIPLHSTQRLNNSYTLPRSRSQPSNKSRTQDYQILSYTGDTHYVTSSRLPPIKEFQKEFREGRRESGSSSTSISRPSVASSSTRIRCAQKIVTQLEAPAPLVPKKTNSFFKSPLRHLHRDDRSTDSEPSASHKKNEPKNKHKNDIRLIEEKTKKDEANENKKNESAEKKKEEKLKQKAEAEAKKEAKKLAKEEEKQAKLLAKEEKKRAKKEAKIQAKK